MTWGPASPPGLDLGFQGADFKLAAPRPFLGDTRPWAPSTRDSDVPAEGPDESQCPSAWLPVLTGLHSRDPSPTCCYNSMRGFTLQTLQINTVLGPQTILSVSNSLGLRGL